MSIYDYSVIDAEGHDFPLKNFEGKVVVIVNTATGCGFTPQYKDLEAMYEKYRDQGLEILDIPCNQFKEQAPGSNEEIRKFCELYFGTQFAQMNKSCVNGDHALPLYKYLKSRQAFRGFTGPKAEKMNGLLATIDPDFKNNPDIKWNFTKFIVDRKGEVVARFEPTAEMADVEKFAASLL